MLTEREELSIKLLGLTAFIRGPEFMTISKNERNLLKTQLHHMLDYYAALVERILFYTQRSGLMAPTRSVTQPETFNGENS